MRGALISQARMTPSGDSKMRGRIVEVVLDAILPAKDEAAELERQVAIRDLLSFNSFRLHGTDHIDVALTIAPVGNRFAFVIRSPGGDTLLTHVMATNAFWRLMNEYVQICNALHDAAASQDPYKVESIDMTRRAIHDDASKLLKSRLSSRVDMDTETARRLFTLLVAYLWRGPMFPAG